MAVIYRIINLISKKIYIGETKEKNPLTRWRKHLNNINKGKGCPALRDAIKKYEIDNFKFEILIFCFDDDRFKYEINYIQKFNSIVPNGYNISKGGYGGGFINKKHTEETKSKIKEHFNNLYADNPHLKKEISERNK
jgi:group I intron endonuclease